MRSVVGNRLVLLGLLAVALTAVVAFRATPFQPQVSCCDHLFYRSMAFNLVVETRPELNAWPPTLDLGRLYADPYHGRYLKIENRFNRQPPYSYRVVTPLVARVLAYPLGNDINRAFYALSFAAIALACFWTARSVLALSGGLLAAIVTIFSFSAVFRLTRYHLTNYMLTDPLALMFIALGTYLMWRRNDRWFFVVGFVAVFNKEIHFFLLASYALMQLAERCLDRRSIAMYAVICISYLALRLTLPIPNDTYSLSSLYLGLPSLGTVARTALSVFGILALFTLSRVWLRRFTLYLLPLVAGAFLTTLFAVDAERSYVYAFPVVFLSVFGVSAHTRAARLLAVSPGLVFVLMVLAQPRLEAVSQQGWDRLSFGLFLVLEGAFFIANYGEIARARWLRRPAAPFTRS